MGYCLLCGCIYSVCMGQLIDSTCSGCQIDAVDAGCKYVVRYVPPFPNALFWQQHLLTAVGLPQRARKGRNIASSRLWL